MQGNLIDRSHAASDQAVPERRRHGDHGRVARRRSASSSVCRSRTTCWCARRVSPIARWPARSTTCRARSCSVAVDNDAPVAAGMPAQLDVFFDNSPVFRLKPDAALQGHEGRSRGSTRDAAAQRLGVGPELSRGRRGDRRGEATARARSTSSDRRSPSVASRTGRSSSCSTASTRRRSLRASFPNGAVGVKARPRQCAGGPSFIQGKGERSSVGYGLISVDDERISVDYGLISVDTS